MMISLQGCPDQRSRINLSYSDNDPDMFGLVTSILQEHHKPEAMTEWDSQSKSFLLSWTTDLENSNRYSSLFPLNIWDHENPTNLIESQSSYEEKLDELSSAELFSRKLDDLQVTGSCPLPCPPCFPPPSHELLKPSDPQNEDFTPIDLNQPSNIVPECSNIKEPVDVTMGASSSQIWTVCNGEQQEGIPRGDPGASDAEESVQLPHCATDGIWDSAIQKNQWCAKRSTYGSSQFMFPITSPFQQENSIPEGANTELHQSQQQNFPNNPSTFFNNVTSKNSAYLLRDSSNLIPSPPGFQQLNSSYSGDKRLECRSLNPEKALCVTFGSQIAPRKFGHLQNCEFSSCKENLKPHSSPRCSWIDLRALPSEGLSEISRNISSRGRPWCPPANRFEKWHSLDSAPNGDHAGQKTGQNERQAKMKRAYADQDWSQLDALRRKKKMGNMFVNPSFFPVFLSVKRCSQNPNVPAFHPPHFSPDNLRYDNFPRSSHFINRDSSALYRTLSSPLPHNRLVTNHGVPSRTLYISLEECYKQWRTLERERTKIEADLARIFPGTSFATSSEIPFFRLPANPSRLDRLIWVQFQEQAKVCTLLEKMEHLSGVSIDVSIFTTLGRHLEAIHKTQARRKTEIFNAGNPWKSGRSSVTNEKDTLALASAVNKLKFSTRKTHTALWCAFQHSTFQRKMTGILD